jgi:hypothetical protein
MRTKCLFCRRKRLDGKVYCKRHKRHRLLRLFTPADWVQTEATTIKTLTLDDLRRIRGVVAAGASMDGA